MNSNSSVIQKLKDNLQTLADTVSNGKIETTANINLSNNDMNLHEINNNSISINSGTVDNGCQRMTIATDDAVNTKLTNIQNSVDLLDNAVNGNTFNVSIDGSDQTGNLQVQSNNSNLATENTLTGIENETAKITQTHSNTATNDGNVLVAGVNSSGNVDRLLTDDNGSLNTNIERFVGNTINLNNGTASTGTLRMVLASDSNLKTQNYFIRRYNANKLFSIVTRLGNFGSASTYYVNPYNFVGTAYGEQSTGTTVAISSSSSSDTGSKFYIEGYSTSNELISEFITTDGTDGQTRVTSANTYNSVTKFENADLSNAQADLAGAVHLFIRIKPNSNSWRPF